MAKPAQGGYLNKATLEVLGSKSRLYKGLGGNSLYCNYNGEKGNVESKLKTCQEIKSEAKKITDGLCYIHSKRENEDSDESLYKAFCHALYYWLGELVWTKIGDAGGTTFSKIMHKIYEALLEFHIPNNCTIMDTDTKNLDKDLFLNRKTVFDFSYDFNGIKTKLNQFSNTCDKGYYQHLEKAVTAYQAVKADCESKTDTDPYCIEFKKVFAECTQQKELEIKSTSECIKASTSSLEGKNCNLADGSEQGVLVYKDVKFGCSPKFVWSPGIFVPASSSGNTAMAATTAISSIFGVVGLPTLAYALYKYGLLPSWIHNTFGNHFGNNRNRTRRKGRSASRNEFDILTSTDDDTSTTLYSTENSIMEDSNTVYSAAYTTTTHTRGTSNNRREQPQGQRKKNSRNISYQNLNHRI